MSEKTMRKITAYYMANSVYLTNENERLETELESTRKVLDKARDGVVFFCKLLDIAMRALAKISKQDTDWCNKGYLVAIARNALEQIIALEQKE